jgi:hypothetical protein
MREISGQPSSIPFSGEILVWRKLSGMSTS